MMTKIFAAFSILAICLPLQAQSGHNGSGLVFICHKGLDYSRDEVKSAYRAYLDEPRPADNKALYSSMLQVIGYSPERYKKVWEKNFFRRALFIPKMLDGDNAVIQWVASSYGGVGYVHTAPTNNPNVEVCGN